MEIPLLQVPVNGNPVCQSYQSKARVHVYAHVYVHAKKVMCIYFKIF